MILPPQYHSLNTTHDIALTIFSDNLGQWFVGRFGKSPYQGFLYNDQALAFISGYCTALREFNPTLKASLISLS